MKINKKIIEIIMLAIPFIVLFAIMAIKEGILATILIIILFAWIYFGTKMYSE